VAAGAPAAASRRTTAVIPLRKRLVLRIGGYLPRPGAATIMPPTGVARGSSRSAPRGWCPPRESEYNGRRSPVAQPVEQVAVVTAASRTKDGMEKRANSGNPTSPGDTGTLSEAPAVHAAGDRAETRPRGRTPARPGPGEAPAPYRRPPERSAGRPWG
jgi:hypothetical protein